MRHTNKAPTTLNRIKLNISEKRKASKAAGPSCFDSFTVDKGPTIKLRKQPHTD